MLLWATLVCACARGSKRSVTALLPPPATEQGLPPQRLFGRAHERPPEVALPRGVPGAAPGGGRFGWALGAAAAVRSGGACGARAGGASRLRGSPLSKYTVLLDVALLQGQKLLDRGKNADLQGHMSKGTEKGSLKAVALAACRASIARVAAARH